MSKTYQKDRRAGQSATPPAEVAVPEQVVVSMAEIAESAKEGLLALAVSTGLQVMTAMFEEDVTRLCGPGGKHNPDRAGYRHGAGSGAQRPARPVSPDPGTSRCLARGCWTRARGLQGTCKRSGRRWYA